MVDFADANVIALLTRAPSAGGKTRLFSALDRPCDPALLRALLLDTLENAAAPNTRRIVFVEPSSACEEIRSIVPPDVSVSAQAEGSLGDRMRAAMTLSFAAGARAVAVIGSDLPTITPPRIIQAFDLLGRSRAALVLGPSRDGGYYLVAASAVPDVFRDIEWGTARVLSQTKERASAAGLEVHLLDSLADVDTLETLLECSVASHAVRTGAWVREQRLNVKKSMKSS